jgi:uncharacterized protein (TIGR03086 family)
MKNTGTLKVTTPTDREIVMTRVFDAPRHLVFDAFTKPELLKRWFGPRGWSLEVCEVDLRVGGGFRFVLRGPDGAQMGMRGVYREIVPPERSVHMESFDDYPGESQVTTVLVEQDGKTTLTATVLYPSAEVRDIVIKSGMEHGAAESYDKLNELLTTSSIADRYRRVAGQFTEVVAAVPPDAWSNPSPCAGWDARAVVRHNVDMSAFILSLIDRTLPADAPSVDDDPLRAWRAARDTVQAALDDPAVTAQEHKEHRHLGKGPWANAVNMVLSSDVVIHTWDLARSIGRDARLDPDEVRGFWAGLSQFDDAALRQPEVFGPALDPPPGADEQTKLLAFLGRKAW